MNNDSKLIFEAYKKRDSVYGKSSDPTNQDLDSKYTNISWGYTSFGNYVIYPKMNANVDGLKEGSLVKWHKWHEGKEVPNTLQFGIVVNYYEIHKKSVAENENYIYIVPMPKDILDKMKPEDRKMGLDLSDI